MSFTPIFADLVKNATTVQGTGAAVLGAPPAGFTGFADACSAGDQFYYCIQGTDKPAEREVGKGTMQANGSILRERLDGGALTKFTAGNKTISLVAAADWFGRIEQQSGKAGLSALASRALLAGEPVSEGAVRMLGEAGREGLFVFVSGDQSAEVSADPLQGVVIPPTAAPGGESGAWMRRFTGPAWVDWWGAAGDDVEDDGPAFAAAIAWLRSRSRSYTDAYYKGSARLRIGAKTYFLGTTTLDIAHTLTIEGEGTGLDGGVPTRLRWAAGTTGIRVQRYNTEGASGTNDAPGQRAGDGTIIRGLFLRGAYSGSESEAHGIHLRARALVEDCYIYQFEGDGIHINGSSPYGNANNFQLNRVSATANRDGVNVGEGGSADVNAGIGTAVNAIGNRRWGIADRSFLGNSWIACHTADNGLQIGSTPTVVSDGTYRYCVRMGQAAGAATNPPTSGGDNAFWLYADVAGPSPANNIPLWTSGMTVREGGSYMAVDPNNRCVFVGCYSEGGQGLGQIGGQAIAIGGLANFRGVWIKGENGNFKSESEVILGKTLRVDGTTTLQQRLKLDGGGLNSLIQQMRSPSSWGSLYHNSFGYGMEAYDTDLGYQPVAQLGSNLLFVHNGTNVIVDMDQGGIKLSAGKTLKIGGTQVLSARGAEVPDASGGSNVDSEARAAINTLLARIREHGLIA